MGYNFKAQLFFQINMTVATLLSSTITIYGIQLRFKKLEYGSNYTWIDFIHDVIMDLATLKELQYLLYCQEKGLQITFKLCFVFTRFMSNCVNDTFNLY